MSVVRLAYISGVAFFTHILNFPRTLLTRLRNKRRQERYRVGTMFPLKATLTLPDDRPAPRQAAPGGAGSDWSGQVSDVSANGLSIRLPTAAAGSRGVSTNVRLTLEGRELAIPCTVAHFRAQPAHALCGLRLDFPNFTDQKAWQQIVEAVSLGASFTPAEGHRALQPSLGLVRRQWRSLQQARLAEWRETGTRKIDRFELVLAGHSIEGRATERLFEIRAEADRGRALPSAVEAEVRQLFLWVTANLPAAVPADLREFMMHSATAPAAPSKRGPPSALSGSPPSEWAAPKRPPRRSR